jgi:hypothetical protein
LTPCANFKSSLSSKWGKRVRFHNTIVLYRTLCLLNFLSLWEKNWFDLINNFLRLEIYLIQLKFNLIISFN